MAGSSKAVPYALFACLECRPVVVVGGGSVAERKVQTLLEHGAMVRVVAPWVTETLRQLVSAGRIDWARRGYRKGDLEGALLVVGATDDRAVNEAVYADACAQGTLVNIVDVPDLCTFIVPSVMRRGRLQVAVSTAGAAPSAARRIRAQLEEDFPAWWEDYLDLLAEVRVLVKQRVPGPASVRTPLYEALSSGEVRDRFAAGARPTAEDAFATWVQPLLNDTQRPSRHEAEPPSKEEA